MIRIRRLLNRAIDENDSTQLKVILRYHCSTIDLEHRNEEGRTLLHEACARGCMDIVRVLVDRGACLEALDSEGNTALHYSCVQNHFHVTRYLILNCANLNTKNLSGELPIDFCSDTNLRLLVEMAMSVHSMESGCMTMGRVRSRKRTVNPRMASQDLTTSVTEIKEEPKTAEVTIKPTFNKNRRSSWNAVKKKESFKLREPMSRIAKLKAKLYGKKMQRIHKSSSDTDIQRLNNETSSLQKVENTYQMNLVGLTI